MCRSKHDSMHPRQVVCADRSLESLWQTIKRHLATGKWHLIDGPSFVVWRWRYQAILQKVMPIMSARWPPVIACRGLLSLTILAFSLTR
jgi:hypothetical protein